MVSNTTKSDINFLVFCNWCSNFGVTAMDPNVCMKYPGIESNTYHSHSLIDCVVRKINVSKGTNIFCAKYVCFFCMTWDDFGGQVQAYAIPPESVGRRKREPVPTAGVQNLV